ncbi:MAG: hypothetical protein N2643_04635 [Endomicrobia bacterium]|nr:hypothetical protein [Endomicrobiia bacterium]
MSDLKLNSILYVCSGNVFRSVFAEGYTLHLLAKNSRRNINIGSCGIIADPSFVLPQSIKKIFSLYGIKEKQLTKHTPTKMNEYLLKTFDLILVMEKCHLDFIYNNFNDFFSKAFLLKEFAGFYSNPEIYDPIGQPESVYIKTAEEIKLCVEIIVKKYYNINDVNKKE